MKIDVKCNWGLEEAIDPAASCRSRHQQSTELAMYQPQYGELSPEQGEEDKGNGESDICEVKGSALALKVRTDQMQVQCLKTDHEQVWPLGSWTPRSHLQ